VTDAGHKIVEYKIIKDEPADLEQVLAGLLARSDVEAILTNGGTGISKRDQTIDVLARRIEIPLPGFGELFRMLSWEQIGSGAMLSRAVGGICRGKLIFAMPGSTKAVELAMSRLILPELGHLVRELRK
jgi:molybdenum cofactor biosynthesis protein B